MLNKKVHTSIILTSWYSHGNSSEAITIYDAELPMTASLSLLFHCSIFSSVNDNILLIEASTLLTYFSVHSSNTHTWHHLCLNNCRFEIKRSAKWVQVRTDGIRENSARKTRTDACSYLWPGFARGSNRKDPLQRWPNVSEMLWVDSKLANFSDVLVPTLSSRFL